MHRIPVPPKFPCLFWHICRNYSNYFFANASRNTPCPTFGNNVFLPRITHKASDVFHHLPFCFKFVCFHFLLHDRKNLLLIGDDKFFKIADNLLPFPFVLLFGGVRKPVRNILDRQILAPVWAFHFFRTPHFIGNFLRTRETFFVQYVFITIELVWLSWHNEWTHASNTNDFPNHLEKRMFEIIHEKIRR